MPNHAWESRAVDYIEDHLREPVAIADVADAVSYSLYHFCRVCNAATHHTLYDYVMRRRLSEAARDLLRTDRRIIDIALDYQFKSPETFSRAFKRVFYQQPSELRRRGSLDPRQAMHRLTPAHLAQIAKGAYGRPILVVREAFWVAGWMTRVRGDRAACCELWAALDPLLKAETGAAGPGERHGFVTYAQGWERQGRTYVAGVEVCRPEDVGDTLILKRIPALHYARFVHQGPARDLDLTLDYVYHTWLPKSGKTLAAPLVVERYDRDWSWEQEDARVEVYFPVSAP